jgi:hypothetical protein
MTKETEKFHNNQIIAQVHQRNLEYVGLVCHFFTDILMKEPGVEYRLYSMNVRKRVVDFTHKKFE